jgi:voltage-gated potassium channel
MRLLRRVLARFRNNPASARFAIVAIISVTASVVLVGALLVWALDRSSYPSYGEAVWFTLQTVTTVGYGDSTPTSWLGRFVAGVVMLVGIGLITVVTAAISSIFIEAVRSQARRSQAEAAADVSQALDRMEASLAEIAARLHHLEAAGRNDHQPPPGT